jgi:hypothetical protein
MTTPTPDELDKLVHALREGANHRAVQGSIFDPIMREAADAITALRAQVAELTQLRFDDGADVVKLVAQLAKWDGYERFVCSAGHEYATKRGNTPPKLKRVEGKQWISGRHDCEYCLEMRVSVLSARIAELEADRERLSEENRRWTLRDARAKLEEES